MFVIVVLAVGYGLLLEKYGKEIGELGGRVIIGLLWLMGIAAVLGIGWGLVALVHLAWRHS